MNKSDQITKKQDDTDLIELFKDFEIIFAKGRINKTNIDWSVVTDFKVFKRYLIKDIEDIQEKLKNPNDDYLFYVCEHIYNIQDWIKLITEDAGLVTFTAAWEGVFDENFGDKHLLQSIYDTCFEKWVSGKEGQYKIGENFYNILDGKLYYRNRFCQWFEVENATAFDLKPIKALIKNKDTLDQLNNDYKETWYDFIIKKWGYNQYQGVLPDNFLDFKGKETSPEEYSDFSLSNIKKLLENPISISELERWNGEKIIELEDILKIATLASDIIEKRRRDDSHTVYLLRDCLVFYEMHKTIDILNREKTSADQILIGRKLLTHPVREWAYYVITLEALYNAHLRYPSSFTDFYNEYARLLDKFVELNSGFASVITDLADYVKKHIQTEKNKIVIFDIGFQGSIALLVKYIIDRHIKPAGPNGNIETDIDIGVGAQWSKKLFGDRYHGDYFPFLNRLQLLTRSNELYHYKEGSLNSGKLRVKMGNPKAQRKAAIELAVFVMVAFLKQTDK